MWALGRYDLGLSEEEFWGLTLKELNALVERYMANHNWLDYRTGLICSVLANIWRGKSVKAFTPSDFMPSETSKQQTPEQVLSTVQMLNAAFGGSVTEV